MEVGLQTGRGVFEVLAHISRSPLEALRQFVENASDAVEQSGRSDGRVVVRLVEGEAGLAEVVVDDNGIGMSPVKMLHVLHSIGYSEKLELMLRGEKGVGLLAFGLIARELHLSSCCQDGGPSACLVLRQDGLRDGKGEVVENCPYHARTKAGATAYLIGVLPGAATSLNWKHLKEYLSREFAVDLRRQRYDLVLEGEGRWEPVHARRYRGLVVLSRTLPLPTCGHATVEFHALPVEASDASVSLYGRSGIRICGLSSLEPFQRDPWTGGHMEGYVRCDRLKRSADKTAVVQDQVYRELVEALGALEPQLNREISRVTQEHLSRRLGRVVRHVDLLVERFLRYLQEGQPLHVPNGNGNGYHGNGYNGSGHNGNGYHSKGENPPGVLGDVEIRRGGGRRHFQPAHYQLARPRENYEDWRSWDGGGEELVKVNMIHPDFLEAAKDDGRCARYLFALWAKEHLLSEYGSDARKVSELLVSWLNKADPILDHI